MRSLNRVMLIGHLATDPEFRQTPTGTPVTQFPIATNRSWKDPNGELKQDVEFHRVVAWRKLAEHCDKFLKKGSGVYIEGRLAHRTYEKDGVKKYFTEVIADTVNFLRNSKLAPSGA